MIVARAQDGAIGKDNDMLWSLPDDMQYFKDQTKWHHVLMGRKNFDSLPPSFKPLPNRTNIVITRNKDWKAEGTVVFHTIEEGMNYAKKQGEGELFIIGGGQIYKQGLPIADKLYITEVFAEFPDAHAHFPDFDPDIWEEVSREKHDKDERHPYAFDFVVYERLKHQ